MKVDRGPQSLGSDDIYYSTRVQNDNAKDAIFSYIMTPANQIVNTTAWKIVQNPEPCQLYD